MLNKLTDENIKSELAENELPSVILFTADWCTLCKDVLASFEELSTEFSSKMKFYTCNIDENRNTRIKFAVASLPYIVYVADGVVAPLFDSIVSIDAMRERFNYALSGNSIPGSRPLKI